MAGRSRYFYRFMGHDDHFKTRQMKGEYREIDKLPDAKKFAKAWLSRHAPEGPNARASLEKSDRRGYNWGTVSWRGQRGSPWQQQPGAPEWWVGKKSETKVRETRVKAAPQTHADVAKLLKAAGKPPAGKRWIWNQREGYPEAKKVEAGARGTFWAFKQTTATLFPYNITFGETGARVISVGTKVEAKRSVSYLNKHVTPKMVYAMMADKQGSPGGPRDTFHHHVEESKRDKAREALHDKLFKQDAARKLKAVLARKREREQKAFQAASAKGLRAGTAKKTTTKKPRKSASKCKPRQEGCVMVREYWRKKRAKK